MATQNVGFAEFAIMTRKDDRLGTDVICLCLSKRIHGLASLKLQNLRLAESEFPEIFKICSLLQFLALENCDMGMLSFLELEHPELSELEIVECRFGMVRSKVATKAHTSDLFWLGLSALSQLDRKSVV